MSGISANALASIPLMRANTGNGANENANGAPLAPINFQPAPSHSPDF